jgi:hypothetical protein
MSGAFSMIIGVSAALAMASPRPIASTFPSGHATQMPPWVA